MVRVGLRLQKVGPPWGKEGPERWGPGGDVPAECWGGVFCVVSLPRRGLEWGQPRDQAGIQAHAAGDRAFSQGGDRGGSREGTWFFFSRPLSDLPWTPPPWLTLGL